MRRPRILVVLCLVLLSAGALGLWWPLGNQLAAARKPVPVLVPLASELIPPALSPPSKTFQLEGPGKPRELEAGVVHSYPFDLNADEFLRLEVEQRGLDVEVAVLDPAGQTVLVVDTLNGRVGPEDIPFVVQRSGVHLAQIRLLSSDGAGSTYLASLKLHRRATPKDRTWADAAISYFQAERSRLSRTSHREAEHKYQKAIRLWCKVGASAGPADALFWLGHIRGEAREWSAARDFYLEALTLYRELGSERRQLAVLNNMGTVLEKLAEPEQALESYAEALALARRLGDRIGEIAVLRNLGLMQFELDEVDKALSAYDQAASLAQEVGDSRAEAVTLNARGSVLAQMGKIEEALGNHSKALNVFKLLGDEGQKAATLAHIADAYREAAQFPLAFAYYQQALPLRRKHGPLEDESMVLNNLGLAYYNASRFEEAIDPYQQALAIFQKLGDRRGEAITWTNIGWLYIALKRPASALEAFRLALPKAQALEQHSILAAIHLGIAWAEHLRNNLITAQKLAVQALEEMESLRSRTDQLDFRISFLAKRQAFYDLLVEVLMQRHRRQPGAGYDLQAFQIGERARARGLLDSLGEGSVPRILSLSQVQSEVVDAKTILLAYFLGEPNSYLWAVTQATAISYVLPSRRTIETLARDVHVSMQDDARLMEAADKARELSRLLLGQVANRLNTERLLIVVPPALQYIPFGALPDPRVTDRERSGDFWPTPLLVRHEVSGAPSASVVAALDQLRRGRRKPPGLLALVADAVYSPEDERLQRRIREGKARQPDRDPLEGRFKRLDFADDEAEAIAAAAGETGVLRLQRFDANRGRLLDGSLGKYKYLHFAVHGDLNSRHAELSGLVLSAFSETGQPFDPFLRVRDIEKMSLSADLVVLSACSTGLGEEIRGEGLVGLTQAFFSAGVPQVIVTLWDVRDVSSSKLMASFYPNLLRKGLTPSSALRKAQISLWSNERWNAPSNWAGFVVQGGLR